VVRILLAGHRCSMLAVLLPTKEVELFTGARRSTLSAKEFLLHFLSV
jgi:hypothetical protein